MAQWVKSWSEKPDKFGPLNPLKLDKVAQASVTTLSPYWDRGSGHRIITRSPQASQLSVCSGEQEVSCLKQGEDRHPGLSSDLQTCTERDACIPTLTYPNCFIVVCMYVCVCMHTYLYTHMYMVVFTILTSLMCSSVTLRVADFLKDIPSGLCFGIISATVGS